MLKSIKSTKVKYFINLQPPKLLNKALPNKMNIKPSTIFRKLFWVE